MLSRSFWLGGAAAALLLLGLFLWSRLGGGPAAPPSPQQLALGKAVYGDHCASCHGANLEGQPDWQVRLPNGRLPAPPHDVSGHTWHHPDAVLFEITKDGLGRYAPAGYETDMPAYAGVLSGDQIRAVLAYIKSTWPPDIQARQSDISAQAQRAGN